MDAPRRHGTFPTREDCFVSHGRSVMARKYSKKASAKVGRAMKKRKAGTLRSGRAGRKVKRRKQGIANGLAGARGAGKKGPPKQRSGRGSNKRAGKRAKGSA